MALHAGLLYSIGIDNCIKGPSKNDVTHLGGRGDLPKDDVTPFSYLVKWVTGGGKGKKSP